MSDDFWAKTALGMVDKSKQEAQTTMSDTSIKRWTAGEIYWKAQEDIDWDPGFVEAADHAAAIEFWMKRCVLRDETIAERQYRIELLTKELAEAKARTKKECPRCEFWDRKPSDILRQETELTTARLVIAKLREQRNHWMKSHAYSQNPTQVLTQYREWEEKHDAEIEALEGKKS